MSTRLSAPVHTSASTPDVLIAARPRRADAVRNAEKVLEAAREVFAEKGVEAGIDEIALRAGVGKATVYRCYATKEELLAAVAGARVAWFTDLVLEALQGEDAAAGLSQLLRTAAETHALNALLSPGLGVASEAPELQRQRAACRSAVQALLDRGKQQGSVRADATARDVTVLFCGIATLLSEQGERDPAVWSRYADLVSAALRP